jgi:YHS domain-containing protein
LAIDPVCKMQVDEKSAKWVSDYKDKKYYFAQKAARLVLTKIRRST